MNIDASAGKAKCTDIDKALFSFVWIVGILIVLIVLSVPISCYRTKQPCCCGASAERLIFVLWVSTQLLLDIPSFGSAVYLVDT